MRLFSFNENSFLNSSLARIVNGLLMFVILVVGLSNAASLKMTYPMIVFITAATAFLSYIAIRKVLSTTTFYEWDFTERKKKERFIVNYSIVCVFICSLLAFSLVIAYIAIKEVDMPLMGYILFAVPVLFFGFNLCNIISLYYPMFDDDLTLGYKIQKRPDNWQEDGKEIKNEDEIKEIMKRDFGI